MIILKHFKHKSGRTTIKYDSIGDAARTPVKIGPTDIPPSPGVLSSLKELRETAARWSEVKMDDDHACMPFQIDVTFEGEEFRVKMQFMRTLVNSTAPLKMDTPTKFSPGYEGAPEKDIMPAKDAKRLRSIFAQIENHIASIPEEQPDLFSDAPADMELAA